MADYSYNEIMKMQNDAIRRVNEMQKKAKIVISKEDVVEDTFTENDDFGGISEKKADAVKRIKMPNDYLNELKGFASTSSYFEDSVKKEKIKNQEINLSKKESNNLNRVSNSFEDKIKSLFGDFSLDSDKALILSLVMLLSEEKADEMLILALLYLLT